MSHAESSQTGSAAIDRLFADWSDPRRPGGATAVVAGGELLNRRCYGAADVGTGEAFRSDRPFAIASLTKQFTALAVLLLEQRGLLSLDDELHKLCPECTRIGRPITLRQLLGNTSGLRDYITLATFAGGQLVRKLDADDIRQLIAGQEKLNFEPGTRYCYSNTNYVLLSRIIEQVTGEPLATAFDRLLFRPLGMSDTVLLPDPTRPPPGAVRGYLGTPSGDFQPWHWDMHMAGDGGIWSTLDDLIRWEMNFARPQLGSRELLDRLGQPVRLSDGTDSAYGLGLTTGQLCGHAWEGHSGGFDGYRSFRMRFPRLDLGIITLANHTADIQGAASEVASLFLPQPTPLQHLQGRYTSRELASVYSISACDGQLLLGIDGPCGTIGELPLVRRGDLEFSPSRAARQRWILEFDTRLRFELNDSGNALRLVVGCEWASDIVFERQADMPGSLLTPAQRSP